MSEEKQRLMNAAATQLELAARALRKGDESGVEWLSSTPDGERVPGTLDDAKDATEGWCEPDGEWSPEMDCVAWGVYVRVEVAEEGGQSDDPSGRFDYEMVPAVAK